MKKGARSVNSYVSFGHEVYKNLFSSLLFKRKTNKKNIENRYVSTNDNKNDDHLVTKNNEFISSYDNEDDNKLNIENENYIVTSNLINTNYINIIDDKHKNSKIDDPNNYPEFETTEENSLIFAIEGFNDENIFRTANALNKALNKKNDKVDINTFLEIYRLFAEFRWALSCRAKFNLKLSQANDIYNYHKYSYKTGEEIQTKEFYAQEATEINGSTSGNEKNVVNKEDHIYFEYEQSIQEYKWPWWQIFLWLLGIFPGLIHEIWRRNEIEPLKTKLDSCLKEREMMPDLHFAIERQLAFLQANEIFFKNMILKSNDPRFLKQMENKSINTFLRENNNLVNFENRDDNNNVCQKVVPKVKGGMENTHQISINGENYFTKKGKLFLDKKIGNNIEEGMEEYRGNLDEENLSGKQNNPLIDTASHGCIMKAFDNFLGLNVLVDTKLIVTPDGYDVFMKSADGKNAGDIFWSKNVFATDERDISFIRDRTIQRYNYKQEKSNRLGNLKNNPLSPELQDAIIKINFLDYLCSNCDRYTTNLSVWKNGLEGIDNELAFFTGKDWNKQAWVLCIKEDLPNLIPYATQELYEIAKSLIDDKNVNKLIDIYMIFAKTANEKNLLQGAENIRTRARELYDHFKQLETEKRILESVKDFNSKTAIEITKKSLVLNPEKKRCLNRYNQVRAATGMGVLGYINPEIKKIKGPKPQQKNNLFVIPEENENLKDDNDIF